MTARGNGIDLGLEIIEAVRRPGEKLSQQAIAEVCGCSSALIWQLERRAMKKLRRAIEKARRA